LRAIEQTGAPNDVDMDPKVRELALLCMLAAFCAGAAWTHDQDYFAAVFAAACVVAGIEAIQRSR
jgi:hypothetical protein